MRVKGIIAAPMAVADGRANNVNDEEGLFARFKQEQTSKMRIISQWTTESHSTYADHSHGFRLHAPRLPP